jgi:hypothetical protein
MDPKEHLVELIKKLGKGAIVMLEVVKKRRRSLSS